MIDTLMPSTTDPSCHVGIKLIPATTELEGGGAMWADLTVVKAYDAALFLQNLRPGGPWVLTAIDPDTEGTLTRTLTDESAVQRFVDEHDGTSNIYYSVNPTRTAVNKKASKADIAAIEFLLADLDPGAGETSDAAKARYLAALETFTPRPTVLVDSGNGLQALWRLETSVDLSVLSEEKAAKAIEDVEARAKAAMLTLGSKAGTQNIDRVLRLPGTTNLPNAKKRKDGRVACPAALLRFNGVACRLEDFPAPKEATAAPQDDPSEAPNDEIERLIKTQAIPVGERSEAVWKVVNALLRRGYYPDAIVKVLLNRKNGISAHIYDQNEPPEYAARQVKQALKKLVFTVDQDGKPYPAQSNIRIALLKLDVMVRYNEFSDQLMVTGLPPSFGPFLDDAGLDRLWLQTDEQFRLRTSKDKFFTVIKDTARKNALHPVRDYLASLQWDGVPRIDKWLTTYGGAEHTPYTSAVGRLVLLAAARRVRRPGIKFDEMLVLENPDQGNNRSTALAVLAIHDHWFSDDLPLNVAGKQIIEMIRGRWIVEASELSGMRRGEIEHIKAMLSRTHDRARMAYDRAVTDAPRQCVFIGTTNNAEYLRDTTGNRRFWPVRVGRFDLEALRRDRDQLWAEAATREAKGESIRLDQSLWPVAEREQRLRLTNDPYYDVLHDALTGLDGKISSEDIWRLLDVKPGHRTQEANARMGAAMRALGWQRPNTAGTIKIGGKMVMGYVKGDGPPRPRVEVVQDFDVMVARLKEDKEDEQEPLAPPSPSPLAP
jgi:Virulence-associated protein E